MKPELQAGARLFNSGHYWEAHEAWEDPWREASGDERAFVQALILLAAALHKRWSHGSRTARNYHKAGRYLAQLPELYDGVNLHDLSREVALALEDQSVRPQLPVDS